MGTSEVSFIATGDSFITRRLPEKKTIENEKIANLIRRADVKFTNFEVTTPGRNAPPSAFSGGTWARADERVIRDLKWFGFNCVNLATNHALDYLYEGLSNTMKSLDEEELLFVGVGCNLAEAASPKYLETPSGRIAMIGTTSTFHEGWMAGEQRRDSKGRPGVNGLNYSTIYQVTEEKLELLKGIAEQVGVNNQRNLDRAEGFLVSDEEEKVEFGNYQFEPSTSNGSYRIANEQDVARIVCAIHEAKRQADYVVVSFHSHEMDGIYKNKPADFMIAASRRFIDAGAHAIIGHGPHILRGIELYKKRPIFYSLGNFIFQNETVERLPADFYTSYDLTNNHNVADGMDKRSLNNSRGLGVNPVVWESVIAEWKMHNGELTELILHPIELGFEMSRYRKGWPTLSSKTQILESLQKLSTPFGTYIEIKNGVGKIFI